MVRAVPAAEGAARAPPPGPDRAVPVEGVSIECPTSRGNRTGDKLLAHLAQGIVPEHGYVDLNIHSVWALIAVRPDLLHSGTATRTLHDRLPVMLDSREFSPRARRELGSIRYAIRLAEA